jgi:predicted phage terminase large subunit-like protein
MPNNGLFHTWLILAGRGFGKTRTGAESVRSLIASGRAKHIGLIGQSLIEAESVMISGESGLMRVFPPHEKPTFKASTQKLIFQNGATATLYSAHSPERLRGPQFDCVWIDEFAKFKKPKEVFDQVMMGLRLGDNPRCIITTTPRPIPFLKTLMDDPKTITTRGTTFDNLKNLSRSFIEHMEKNYAQTRLGAQELYAEILSETDGALWQRSMIHYKVPENDHWRRLVIAIDPATTHHDKSDETGIVVAGLHEDGFVYILEDLSGRWSPSEWGEKVTERYWHFKADRVVAEINKGGDLVERVVKSIDPHIAFKAVRATRGKSVRAEPVAALYEKGRVFHIRPFSLMEQQLCDYVPHLSSKSPDRMDALVWALTDLLLAKEATMDIKVWES